MPVGWPLAGHDLACRAGWLTTAANPYRADGGPRRRWSWCGRISSSGAGLADYRLVAGAYESLAVDYDWMFDDEAVADGRAINRPATARLLQRIGRGSAVLDAACGTGVDAAALARRGFTVWAADESGAMLEAAAARIRRERLAIPVLHSTWEDLPAATSERFDAVLCVGNSLVHAAGRDAMVRALTGLRRMVRPGGHVVIDSRNWEKLHADRQIVQVADRVVSRDGRRCFLLYAWEIPDRLGQEHIAHLVFVFENGGQVQPHEYVITFRPFTVSELRERLELAGLTEVDTDFDDSGDRYAVVTVTALCVPGRPARPERAAHRAARFPLHARSASPSRNVASQAILWRGLTQLGTAPPRRHQDAGLALPARSGRLCPRAPR